MPGRLWKGCVAAVVGCCLAVTAAAQSVVGTAVVSGKPVQLFDDGTWRYRDTVERKDGCRPVSFGVAFCGDPASWKSLPPPGEFDRLYQFNNQFYGGLIVENFGVNRGITIEFIRQVILDIAAEASGITAEEVPILDVSRREVDGVSAETVVYLTKINNTDFIFANTLILTDDMNMQAMVWTINDTYTAEHSGVTDTFIDLLKIGESGE
ncbi:hypothetical protein [Pseudaestuariivita atlantica]|uniref:Uncharacterized protein n=1 Tax=Pseudaestuariivita atlantica TaxID=1317121 RepID=A0A0L1JNP5_9RHOB|nr:hypothetical protein [Pseudaestuariivita atlantica]KNG93003.1 hypothetical protein ATO11_13830 [Pseudaestuariivita atlantica]